ncbi:hypothetical protein M422DRAFT_41940 [Sphaerobolus stellatus SS14]|nr:hypothetical protein M422DRAFT_41940 [Sphaerobolus stellatus SS14]
MNTPSVFTQITLRGRITVDPLKIIALSLDKSKALPVSIDILPNRWLGCPSIIGVNETIRAALSVLSGNLHRMSYLSMTAPCYLQIIFPYNTLRHFSSLETLFLDNLDCEYDHLEDNDGPLRQLVAENLLNFEESSGENFIRDILSAPRLTGICYGALHYTASAALHIAKDFPCIDALRFIMDDQSTAEFVREALPWQNPLAYPLLRRLQICIENQPMQLVEMFKHFEILKLKVLDSSASRSSIFNIPRKASSTPAQPLKNLTAKGKYDSALLELDDCLLSGTRFLNMFDRDIALALCPCLANIELQSMDVNLDLQKAIRGRLKLPKNAKRRRYLRTAPSYDQLPWYNEDIH